MCDKRSEILKSLAPAARRWIVLDNHLWVNQSERAKSTIHLCGIYCLIPIINPSSFLSKRSPSESLVKIQIHSLQLLIFRKANHPIENFKDSGRKVTWNGNSWWEISEDFAYHASFSLFPEIPEDAIPLFTGNFRKLIPELLIEWETPLISELLFTMKHCVFASWCCTPRHTW